MDLPVTTQTSTSREIKILHLEPTDVCQAACPLCARETDLTFDKLAHNHLSIDQIRQHMTMADIAALDKVYMCGVYGDPAAGKYTLEIFRWFRHHNPDIILGMNTNGALQNADWWRELAAIFNQPQDYVVFSIDGLEDTNHLYRVNTSWPKLMDNSRAFISAGGSAHWDMLVYQHNQHQVDDCRALAGTMGFSWFRTKISKRPMIGSLAYPLEYSPQPKFQGPVVCQALEEKSLYIDAKGRVSPCCWLGDNRHYVQDISDVSKTWNTDDCNPICLATCSTNVNKNKFTDQWKTEVKLREI